MASCDLRGPLTAFLLTALFAGEAAAAQTSDGAAPLIAPLGVTFGSVRTGAAGVGNFNNTPQKTTQVVFANAAGMTLYSATGEDGTCDEACLADWSPLVADREPSGEWEWSVVTGAGGVRQWAYQGKPVYTYAKDSEPGQSLGHGIGPMRVLVVQQPFSGKLPTGIAIAAMSEAPGEVLATPDGYPMYAFSGKHRDAAGKCTPSPCGAWKPILAPELARPTGEFTIVAYDPGVHQWAFRGKPLYRYDQDVEAGDVRGESSDKDMKVALVARYFMPANVAIQQNHFGGTSLVTSQGMTLYTRDAANPAQGQSLRIGIHGNPAIGRRLGTGACDQHCTETWTPLIAPADAVAAGYWMPLPRGDGQKQWAYNGYALYTYKGDKAPGDINGFDIYQYAPIGSAALTKADPAKDTNVAAYEGLKQLHWRAVVP